VRLTLNISWNSLGVAYTGELVKATVNRNCLKIPEERKHMPKDISW